MWLQTALIENLCIQLGDSQGCLRIHPTFAAHLLHQNTYLTPLLNLFSSHVYTLVMPPFYLQYNFH